MNSVRRVGRFAPTPSGDLHLGSLVAALASWVHARQHGGLWLIRVDDLDPPREVPGAAARILAALAAFGLHPDRPPTFQSTRAAAYQRALDKLQRQGLVFPCWCSRRELALGDGLHRDGRCAHGPRAEQAPALRLRTPPGTVIFDDLCRGPVHQDVRATVGDFVLRRADGCWSYHLACAVDEAFLGVTEVIRGDDLLPSTARQILLLERLGLPIPRYGHVPLVLDGGGHKLSKSARAAAIDPTDPMPAMRRALAHLAGREPPSAQIRDTAAALRWACAQIHLPAR